MNEKLKNWFAILVCIIAPIAVYLKMRELGYTWYDRKNDKEE